VLGLDLSRGMLADLARGWDIAARPHLAAADIQALPLPGASCDVALAMHMLYHVPDIERAAHELRRVLRPGGALLAVTNSAYHNQELFALYETAFASVAGDGAPGERWDRRFELENGTALLQTAFAQVERRDITGALVIPEATPVLRYLDSTRATRAPALPDRVTWEDLMAEAARIVDRTIVEQGAFRVTTHAGVFVCR
jgi:SAM-dependent methyltransferase